MEGRGNGRKRVKIETMQEASARHVTFSKHRLDLFKTGSDLCTLCGAEVAILVFSSEGEVFSFGHPCLDSVIERYLNQEPPPDDKTQQIALAQRKSSQLDLNNRVTELERLIEEEKKNSEAIHHQIERERAEDPKWWEQPFEVLNLAQLAALKGNLGILRDNVMRKPHMFDACVPSNPIAIRLNPLNMKEHGFCGRNGTPSFLSANRVPINTRAPGFNVTAPYDPMEAGSSHWGPVDTQPPANVSYDPMAAGSSHRGSTDTRATASVTYNPMAAGSSHGMPIYIPTPGFRGNAPYDPIAVGSSHWVPMTLGSVVRDASYNHVAAGSSHGVPIHTRAPRSNGQAPYDPTTTRSSHRVSIDSWAPGYKGKAPHDPMAERTSHKVPIDTRALEFNDQAPYDLSI